MTTRRPPGDPLAGLEDLRLAWLARTGAGASVADVAALVDDAAKLIGSTGAAGALELVDLAGGWAPLGDLVDELARRGRVETTTISAGVGGSDPSGTAGMVSLWEAGRLVGAAIVSCSRDAGGQITGFLLAFADSGHPQTVFRLRFVDPGGLPAALLALAELLEETASSRVTDVTAGVSAVSPWWNAYAGVPIDWQVTGVFDPDGRENSFAYTVGLVAHDLDELHVWSRPTHGHDPGDTFALSGADMARVLNLVARCCVAGQLHSGDSFDHVVDAGDTVLHFELGQSVDASSVDAFGAEPTPVTPLLWTLDRVPPGPNDPVAPGVARDIGDEARLARAEAHLMGSPRWGHAAAPREAIDVTPGQPFGPWTAVVEALAEIVRLMSPDDVVNLALHAVAADDVTGVPSPRYALAQLGSAGRRLGREDAVIGAQAAAVEALAGRRQEVAAALEDAELAGAVVRAATEAAASALSAWVVRDGIDDRLFHGAAAGFEFLVRQGRGEGAARLQPGIRWLAGVAARLGAAEITALGEAALRRPPDDESEVATRALATAIQHGRGTPGGIRFDADAETGCDPDLVAAAALAVSDAALADLVADLVAPADRGLLGEPWWHMRTRR